MIKVYRDKYIVRVDMEKISYISLFFIVGCFHEIFKPVLVNNHQ